MRRGKMGLAELRRWRVVGAQAYKKTDAVSEHEYISATVVDSEGNAHFVAIERGRGEKKVASSEADAGPHTNKAFSSSTSSLSSKSVSDVLSPTRMADDRIAPIPTSDGKWGRRDKLIFRLGFEKPLYLYELALLAYVVQENNDTYLLRTNNCYHYAGTILKVLEARYGVMNTVEGAEAGKWCGIDITGKWEAVAIWDVLRAFQKLVGDFVSFLFLTKLQTFTEAPWV